MLPYLRHLLDPLLPSGLLLRLDLLPPSGRPLHRLPLGPLLRLGLLPRQLPLLPSLLLPLLPPLGRSPHLLPSGLLLRLDPLPRQLLSLLLPPLGRLLRRLPLLPSGLLLPLGLHLQDNLSGLVGLSDLLPPGSPVDQSPPEAP